jgi:CubicO group peptidase (beta-lactamase class C family)
MTIAFVSTLSILALSAPIPTQERRADAELGGRVDALAREVVDKDGVPGLSIAVGKDGVLLLADGWGYADAARGVPARKDTVYEIGSLTRQFTAVAVLQLAEQKKLSLDDALAKWLPDFPTQDQTVTLRHLLTNTSGLPGYEALAAAHGAEIDRGLDREQLFALFGRVPAEFAPGSRFSFNNSGYLLLAMVVEKVSGEPYGEFVREHLIEPLDLERTRFFPASERPLGFARDCRELSDERELEIPIAGGAATSTHSLGSTATDLFRWQCALEDRLLIGERATGEMRTPARLASGDSTGHGFATAVTETDLGPVLSHTGGIGGFRVRLAHYVHSGLTIAVLANCESAPVERLERDVARAALEALPAATADLPIEAAELSRLCGDWQIATQAVRTFERDGSLWFEYAGQPAFRLLHQGRRVFVASNDASWRVVFGGERDEPANSFEVVRNGFTSVGKRLG